jgi:hypothetical protein
VAMVFNVVDVGPLLRWPILLILLLALLLAFHEEEIIGDIQHPLQTQFSEEMFKPISPTQTQIFNTNSANAHTIFLPGRDSKYPRS